jgi:hypothetical protein
MADDKLAETKKVEETRADLKTIRYPLHSEPIKKRLDRALVGKDEQIEKIRTVLRKLGSK